MLRIEKLLSREIGLSAASLGSSAIESAVRQRMSARQVRSLDEYLARLEGSDAERRALVEEVVVSETWFFRDEKVFGALAEYVNGSFRRAHPEGILRVLSVPCATGEEPYSISVTLLEAGLLPNRFIVQGADVSARPLDAARLAVYGKNSVRAEISPSRLRYFEKRSDGLAVSELARRSVSFIQGNVLDPFLVPASIRYDVIFCRNLLIYLDGEGRAKAFDNLSTWLAEGGILFSGHAEAVEMMDDRFARVNDSGRCAYVRRTRAEPRTSQPRRASLRATASGKRKRPALEPTFTPKVPAAEAIRQPTPTSLDHVMALADRGDPTALAACERHISEAGPSAAAYCLLGVIRMTAGDVASAMDGFKRALYLDPRHYQSLIHLALLHERHGEMGKAANLRKRAAREQGKPAAQ